MKQIRFIYETINVWNGEGAVEISLANYKGKRYSLKTINQILNNPLIFGNREQISALEAWELIDSKQRKRGGEALN